MDFADTRGGLGTAAFARCAPRAAGTMGEGSTMPKTVVERRDVQRRRTDRRAAGRMEHQMYWMLWGIGLLNYTDAAQTIFLLHAKLMVEANRLMAALLEHSPYGFWMYKTLVPSLGCVLLWRFRKRVKWLYGAVITVFAVYLTIVIRSFLYMLLPTIPTA
jgi:hypothetical protein